MNAPLHHEMPEGTLDAAQALSHATKQWDSDIVKQITDYITIPAKSPGFDKDWAQHGYLDTGFDALVSLFEANLDREVICLGLRDYHDSVADLKKTIRYFREKGAHFTTLTQAASEHFEHHAALAGV